MLSVEYAKEIHETAVAKGFWEEERDPAEMLMLALSELAEALEEERAGRENFYYGANGKPEGLLIELADFVIRCMDTLHHRAIITGHSDIEYFLDLANAYIPTCKSERVSARLYEISRLTTKAYSEPTGWAIAWLAVAMLEAVKLMNLVILKDEAVKDLSVTFFIRTKMDYNHTRPYKHGKKY